MTNHWNDIDNASMVLVFGANPAENHPACMAHVNAARFGNKNAKLIVVDPRLTRTARQIDPSRGDMYVRIRPGTNVAFSNGLLNWILNNTSYNPGAVANMLAYHNTTNVNLGSVGRTFIDDTGVTRTLASAELAGAKYGGVATTAFQTVTTPSASSSYPKYADTRFVVNAAGNDYERATLTTNSYSTGSAWQFSNFPVVAPTVDSTVGGLKTVWTSMKEHLAAYDTATVADICGCTEAEIVAVAKALVDNSRFASTDATASQATPTVATYKATTILYAMGQTQHTNGSQNIKDLAMIQTVLGNMGRAGGGINALRGIHNVQGSTDMGLLFDSIPAYSGNPGTATSFGAYLNPLFGNRVVGNTAEVKASATVNTTAANSDLTFTSKLVGVLGNAITVEYVAIAADQTLSVGVVGNAITVTLATDSSSVVTTIASQVAAAIAAFPAPNAPVPVANAARNDRTRVGHDSGPIALTGGRDLGTDLSTTISAFGLQQRGFSNMTTEWFGKGTSSGADVAALYDLWPKGNGVQHIQTFRNMTLPLNDPNRIISAVVWGQNPAVTEPNQSKVRAGLKNLDLLVVVDMFETETAAVDRKVGGITYLIPACAHPEEAGSVTNSGRWLQWRERACAPKGNSKADLELLLRFAYALDQNNAFSHILAVWDNLGTPIVPAVTGRAYAELYGKHGWTPNGVPGSFEALSATSETWRPGDTGPVNRTVYGSEVVAESIYKEMCRPLNALADGTASSVTGGTMWIYSGSESATTPGVGGWNGGSSWNLNVMPALTIASGTATWQLHNRAKSRNNVVKGNDTNGANNYPRWGWAWLLNRRVFYNNGEVSGDQGDNFAPPGLVACMFTMSAATTLADWSLVYRAYKKFNDRAESGLSYPDSPHFISAGKTFTGAFPGHTEPYESPREDLVALFGHNTSGGTAGNLMVTGDTRGTVANFPLVLTSIRCVEHFQGGPITRNNSWNVEAEPVPWIEINSVDAREYGIADGDWVNVTTARSNSGSDQEGRSPNSGTGWARGFKARVGVGLQSNQRVAAGVVAIPWHWGDKGLSTGSRANDLCIDAWDANTMIPEYKACLCKIEKM